jgi:hypothetical protein
MPAKKATAARATVDDLAKLRKTLAQKLIGLRRVIAPAGRKETEGSGEDYPIQVRASRWPAKYPWAVRAVAAIDAAWEALQNVMVCHSQVAGRTLPGVLADMGNSGEPSVLAVLEHLRGITELPARETNLGLIERLVRELGVKPRAAAVKGKPVKPLPDTQQRAYDLILAKGPIMGTAICHHIGCSQSSLTGHIIPALKKKPWGVKNCRGAGYYVRPTHGANR